MRLMCGLMCGTHMHALAGTTHEGTACSSQASCGCRQTADAATSERAHIHACVHDRALRAKADHGKGRQDAAALLLVQLKALLQALPLPVLLALVLLQSLMPLPVLLALVPLQVLHR